LKLKVLKELEQGVLLATSCYNSGGHCLIVAAISRFAEQMSTHQTTRVPIARLDEILAMDVVDAAFRVQAKLGPGLLESAYEQCLLVALLERATRFNDKSFCL
jgi:hypothetical protein